MNSRHEPAHHRHEHAFLGARHDRNARATQMVVLVTIVTMVVEIGAGLLTGSMALLADGVHMATHAAALGLAAAAYAYARRHADNSRFAFGTGKFGDLAAFASALFLGLTALGIAWESVMRMIAPGRVAYDEALIVAVLGLIVNLASAWLLRDAPDHHHHHAHGHSHDHAHDHGGHAHDNNMRAAYAHVVTDALTSLLAIAALAGAMIFGWNWLDPLVGIVGAAVILAWSWQLMRDSALVLVDASDDELVREIRERLADTQIVDLHVWRVGPNACVALVSLIADPPATAGDYRQRLTGLPRLKHLTVEVIDCGCIIAP